jgi:hypothetical protein
MANRYPSEMKPALPSFQAGTTGRKTSDRLGGLIARFGMAFLPDIELGNRARVQERIPLLVAAKMTGTPIQMVGKDWAVRAGTDSNDLLEVQNLVKGVPEDPALWQTITEVVGADTTGVRASVGMVAAFINYELQQSGTPLKKIDTDIIASARDALLPTGKDTEEVEVRRHSSIWEMINGRQAIMHRLENESEFDLLGIIDASLNIYRGWARSIPEASEQKQLDKLAITTYLTIVDAQLRRNRAATAPVPLF